MKPFTVGCFPKLHTVFWLEDGLKLQCLKLVRYSFWKQNGLWFQDNLSSSCAEAGLEAQASELG